MATKKRLIDANALMKAIRSFRWIGPPNTLKLMFEYLWLIIRDQPTVDAVEVVRCKNCKEKFEYGPNQFCCFLSRMPIDEDDFCSLGSKMDGEEA